MTDQDKQEQAETEVTYQTFSEFLQNTPPNRLVTVLPALIRSINRQS